MAAITDVKNNWRAGLSPASFRNVIFHVEVGARASGRRSVVHEYPKRNLPYTEDMGRHAVRWQFTGYILNNDKRLQAEASPGWAGKGRRAGGQAVAYETPYFDLIDQRNKLIEALERDGAGLLVHPSLSYSFPGGAAGTSPGGPMLVICERYSVSESRQRGGYYEFDMQFVEAGVKPDPQRVDTKGQVMTAAEEAQAAAVRAVDAALQRTAVASAAGVDISDITPNPVPESPATTFGEESQFTHSGITFP
jgi:hypothetical protein